MTEVTTTVERAGQLLTSGPQLVTVAVEVLNTVEVVNKTPVSVGEAVSVGVELVKLTERLLAGVVVSTTTLLLPAALSVLAAIEEVAAAVELVSDAVEVVPGLQSKLMLWIPISQSSLSECWGSWKVTDLAPPH
jgi:hypothetical protein